MPIRRNLISCQRNHHSHIHIFLQFSVILVQKDEIVKIRKYWVKRFFHYHAVTNMGDRYMCNCKLKIQNENIRITEREVSNVLDKMIFRVASIMLVLSPSWKQGNASFLCLTPTYFKIVIYNRRLKYTICVAFRKSDT